MNITSFNPSSGPEGTTVKISLTGLADGANSDNVFAWIGSTPITNIISVEPSSDPQTVTVKIPSPAVPGELKVACEIDHGIAVSSTQFIVTTGPAPGTPSFETMRPLSGPVGTSVTLEGQNLNQIVRLEFANHEIPDFRKSSAMIAFKVPKSVEPGVYHATGYTEGDQTIICHKMFEVTEE